MNDAEGDENEIHRALPEWERAHTELLRLARERARLDTGEGHWLLRAHRSQAHIRLGYASFAEYVERLFGYSPRWTAEKLRVAEALERLPNLQRTLVNGELAWSAVRELTRVATPETETEWLDAASGRTARDIERLVSGHRAGNRPGGRRDPSAIRRVLHFEVSALVFAAFRDALAKLRRDAGTPVDDDDALLLMARRVLGGPADENEASYQMALTVCEHCRAGTATAHGEPVPVEPQIVHMAACDAQTFPLASDPDDSKSERTHVGRTARAKQSIPPATRRLVHHRDHGRCRVPGCRHAVYVDVHHIDPRAEGGSNTPENLVALCSAHHRAVHRGELILRGSAAALVVRHADGSPYGSLSASPAAANARSKAFRGLRSLGFSEAEARTAMAHVTPHVGRDASAETLLRQALADLTPTARTPTPAREQVFDPKAA